jgi:hypothetical protein
MPTITYLPIATTTVSGTSTASVTFSSIPNTYKDLVLVQYLPGDPTATYGYSNLRFNSDTASNYSSSYQYYYNASTPGRQANVTSILHGTSSYMGNSNIITHIQNYSNTTNNKTSISRVNLSANANGTVQEIFEGTGLYRSTSAITSVTAFISSGNYASGSMFTLYGIL